MYLRYLQYLHAIVEQGSFALAANACGVSQPAISHGMKALQAHFAQPLLVREGRRHVPTDLARAVAAQALPLAQGVEALPRASVTAPDRHRLRVGLTSSAALVCGPLLYACWCLPNARRSLEMATADEGSLLEGLLSGDLCLMNGLASVSRPRAQIEIHLNGGALTEAGSTLDHGAELIYKNMSRHGWDLRTPFRMDHDALRQFPTTWAKRLAYGRDPRAMSLNGKRAP